MQVQFRKLNGKGKPADRISPDKVDSNNWTVLQIKHESGLTPESIQSEIQKKLNLRIDEPVFDPQYKNWTVWNNTGSNASFDSI